MKIFNWVHWKFRQNMDRGVVEDTKGEPEGDKEQLLSEERSLVEVLNGWHHGILTIGTFGLDPVNQLEPEFEPQDPNSELGDVIVVEPSEGIAEVLDLNSKIVMKGEAEDTFEAEKSMGSPETEIVGLEREDGQAKVKEGRERTTLADLFSWDDQVRGGGQGSKEESAGEVHTGKKKGGSRAKHGLSFAKKLIKWKGEESGRCTKLHKLISRALKKKIHPELETCVEVREMKISSNEANMAMHENGLDDESNEAKSLLNGDPHYEVQSLYASVPSVMVMA
ncbi:uncharacterized protein LOC18438889 isoform X2 [Amborella trichopoda]|uniref:uncharacterized protein LOC18438889 isoform X2 n=1 Tax=Amborella trichopoda TaxID=13333 RepID=UPI0009BD2A36|nr:uncharacterized protein LOC18438889 isoform X2 [Amborella trichopoda]|eukprot:XP_020525851.1 uncharacterized protein LOC18438889 isoform X2 [Amborella trichopoda]